MYICVYIYVYTYVCIYVYTCLYVHVYIYIHILVYTVIAYSFKNTFYNAERRQKSHISEHPRSSVKHHKSTV